MQNKFISLSNGEIINRDFIARIGVIRKVTTTDKYYFEIALQDGTVLLLRHPDFETAQNEIRDIVNY